MKVHSDYAPWILCSDCPPLGGDPKMRCLECPRRKQVPTFYSGMPNKALSVEEMQREIDATTPLPKGSDQAMKREEEIELLRRLLSEFAKPVALYEAAHKLAVTPEQSDKLLKRLTRYRAIQMLIGDLMLG